MKTPSSFLRTALRLALAVGGTLHLSSALAAAICSVSAATLDFGNYDVLNLSPTDSTTSIQVTCERNPPPGTEVVTYTLSLSTGTGSYAARTMIRGAESLNYNLYADATRSSAAVWGNGTAGTVTVGNTLPPLNGQNRTRTATHTIYGRIPAQQDVTVGTYSANVILTMDY